LVASISVNGKRIGGAVLLELPTLVHERVDGADTPEVSQDAHAAADGSTAYPVPVDTSGISGAEGLPAHGHMQ
jgi:hypothetical protein